MLEASVFDWMTAVVYVVFFMIACTTALLVIYVALKQKGYK